MARCGTRWCVVVGWLLFVLPSTAQEFRVETEVFVDDQKKPESLTLFAADVVYDFLLLPNEEITMFDIQRGRLVLLDESRQLKAVLTTEQLLEFSAAIKARGMEQGSKHLFDPQFETTYDDESRRLKLASERLTYQAKGLVPKQPDAARRFQQFADGYARLNAMRPGNLPPFGRLLLNQALADRELVPLEIVRELVVDRPVSDKKLVANSRHTFTWLFSNTDRNRIDKVSGYVAKFTEVSADVFWKAPAVAVKSK